jgi:hypothetical protein
LAMCSAYFSAPATLRRLRPLVLGELVQDAVGEVPLRAAVPPVVQGPELAAVLLEHGTGPRRNHPPQAKPGETRGAVQARTYAQRLATGVACRDRTAAASAGSRTGAIAQPRSSLFGAEPIYSPTAQKIGVLVSSPRIPSKLSELTLEEEAPGFYTEGLKFQRSYDFPFLLTYGLAVPKRVLTRPADAEVLTFAASQ